MGAYKMAILEGTGIQTTEIYWIGTESCVIVCDSKAGAKKDSRLELCGW